MAWVGRRCFPTPELLASTFGSSGADASTEQGDRNRFPQRKKSSSWERRCLFIDPPDTKGRLWAIERLLRSPAVGIVVGDGSSFSLIATRKLQLAARTGGGTAFLVRPPWELSTISTAHTRWKVTPSIDPASQLPPSLLRKITPENERDLSGSSITGEEKSRSPDTLLWELSLVRARGYPTPMQWRVAWFEDAIDEKGSLHITVDTSSRKEHRQHVDSARNGAERGVEDRSHYISGRKRNSG